MRTGRELRIEVESPRISGLRSGDVMVFGKFRLAAVRPGDIVLCASGDDAVASRVVRTEFDAGKCVLFTKSDCQHRLDAPLHGDRVLGQLTAVLRNGKRLPAGNFDLGFLGHFTECGTKTVMEKLCDLAFRSLPPRLRPSRLFRRRT